MLSNYTYSKYAINKGYNDDVKLITPYYLKLVSKPNKIDNGYWEFQNCKVQLISSYFEFIGIPPQNYWNKVYASEKLFNPTGDYKYYIIIWRGDENDNWTIKKYKNTYEEVGRIDTSYSGAALYRNSDDLVANKTREHVTWITDNGTYFKAVYRWDNNNDPNTPIINSNTGQIIDWNLKNKNNINNNDEIKVTVKNKDISKNPIYQLEANFFNWLSITNELETNNIPSLIPAEIKLSDGEYGKYLTNLIVSNDKIEEYLNYFSQLYRLLYSKAVWTSITKNLVEDNIKISFYNHQKLFILNQIELSGIWGYGNYDIKIFTEKEEININNLQLFNKNNEKLSLITLEI